MMKISILTMCPELFRYFDDSSIIARSVKAGRLEIEIIDFREYTEGSFRKIDDSPYGGGRGMVIRCQPVVDAIEDTRTSNSHVVLLSPKGQKYDQRMAREYASYEHLILICGHYEGFDARIFPYADEVISIGDYILSGGELAAQIITDSVTRLLDGSLKEGSADDESFENGLLEYPQYTRPADFRGDKVPDVLLSGDHEAIRAWREQQALALTKKYRPDLGLMNGEERQMVNIDIAGAEKYFKYLVEQIHTTVVATVDDEGLPVTAAIDMMDYDGNSLYFLTAKGNYDRLVKRQFLAFTAMKGEDTMSSVALSVRGKVRELDYEKIPELFSKNPYMHQIYPTEEAMKALTVFQIYEGTGEWFDLSRKPIERESFTFGGAEKKAEGFIITDGCIGCGDCVAVCPQGCIDQSAIPYVIEQEHCLHCGNCMSECPAGAVNRI